MLYLIRSEQLMRKNKLSGVSKANTLEKVGEFWDKHDFTEFDNPDVPDVDIKVTCAVPIELDLLTQVEKEARQGGVKVETLVNIWLQQKISEQARSSKVE